METYDYIYEQILTACEEGLVSKGLMKPLTLNDTEALTYAYHTMEEVWEVIRELPRKSWKDQEIDRERLKSELSDVFIQYNKLLAYCGFHLWDIYEEVEKKLSTPRPDWKTNNEVK